MNIMTDSSMALSCALVLEDDLLVAADLCNAIESEGLLTLLVSVNDAAGAASLIKQEHLLAVAVVDVSHPRNVTYAMMDILRTEGIPIVCVSTDPLVALPSPYASLPLFTKPFDLGGLQHVLRQMAINGGGKASPGEVSSCR
jgi:CheY-like chemotaxis protein